MKLPREEWGDEMQAITTEVARRRQEKRARDDEWKSIVASCEKARERRRVEDDKVRGFCGFFAKAQASVFLFFPRSGGRVRSRSPNRVRDPHLAFLSLTLERWCESGSSSDGRSVAKPGRTRLGSSHCSRRLVRSACQERSRLGAAQRR